ncbi:hypothetical protein F5144DRAFT_176595 [Chaetomium tenue]|uniref:Uncharacterized protein n=1 Tax=Chaetomium tenue TaxID=1854479 RepID=A0ACB7PBA7_9PEZI|nr:hypothetical protein F5144DRAFT_176595 [Chaetomium globosum]
MPTAPGVVNFLGDTQVSAVFMIDGSSKIFRANLAPPVQGANSGPGTVTYDNGDFPESASSFSGRLGPDTYQLTFENGLKIEGKFNSAISGTHNVRGAGAWIGA